jgi:hypothetical protein
VGWEGVCVCLGMGNRGGLVLLTGLGRETFIKIWHGLEGERKGGGGCEQKQAKKRRQDDRPPPNCIALFLQRTNPPTHTTNHLQYSYLKAAWFVEGGGVSRLGEVESGVNSNPHGLAVAATSPRKACADCCGCG